MTNLAETQSTVGNRKHQ